MGKCRLCEQETQLIKAHVIPEAFLALPSAEYGPAKIMSAAPGFFPKRTLTGIYDDKILPDYLPSSAMILPRESPKS